MPNKQPMEKQPPLAGLDPAELLKQGVADDTFVDGVPPAFNPPPLEEIAAIFPQFEVLELIGQGGMGAVYKIRQKDLDRVVAMKILSPAIGQSPEFCNRFTREARALAKLNHSGIVTLHEFGQQDGLYFILMEFVDGVNLAQLMKTGRISSREALAIVPQICDALQYAHDQGIVHRDIKPENILIDRLGRVKVADFGIAKVVASVCDRRTHEDDKARRFHGDATLAGKIIGTPHYMAPEQIDHPADVDHRADIYSLGIVFYQMLTGELPGKDFQAPSRKVHIDVRLDEIVLMALEKTPEQRYQQASVMKTRLETIVSEMGSTAVPLASFGTQSNEKLEKGVPLDSRFSRTAIVGACWAPLILFAYVMWFSVSVSVRLSPGEEPPGPAWWQYLMMFTLLPLGLTSPFGTTILGWISVSQIRRSAGKLHGMWLAVLDGLLFPLLALTGLIGWFWHWFFDDLVRAVIINNGSEPPKLQQIIVSNTGEFAVIATIATSLVVGFLIIHRVWRKVSATHSVAASNPAGGAPNQPPRFKISTGAVIAIGCGGVLLLMGLGLVGVGTVYWFFSMKRQQELNHLTSEHVNRTVELAKRKPDQKVEERNQAAVAAVEDWIAGIDAENYAQSWKDASKFFQASITEAAWSEALTSARPPLGKMKTRKLLDAKITKSLPGAPDGEYVIILFDTSFTAKEKAVETVTFMKESDGIWKAVGYLIQ